MGKAGREFGSAMMPKLTPNPTKTYISLADSASWAEFLVMLLTIQDLVTIP
jgi:hypothetical protein